MTALTQQIVNDLRSTLEQYFTYACAILRTPTHRGALRSCDLECVLLSSVRLAVRYENPPEQGVVQAQIQLHGQEIVRLVIPEQEGEAESWQVSVVATRHTFKLQRTILIRTGSHHNNDAHWKRYVVDDCLTYSNGDGETSIVLHSAASPMQQPQLELIRHRGGRRHYAITVAAARPPWTHPRIVALEVGDTDELREAVSGHEIHRWDTAIVGCNILSYLKP